MRLWLDDERDPAVWCALEESGAEKDMVWVKTVEEAKELLMTGDVTFISLDNDLGFNQKEGSILSSWIEEQAYFKKLPRLKWAVHTANPVAHKYITMAMKNADGFWDLLDK